MFRNEFYAIGAAFVALALFTGELTVGIAMGFPVVVLAGVIVIQAVVMCVAVALMDPTYGGGYCFGSGFVAAALGTALAMRSIASRKQFYESLAAGALCMVAMWITYRVRRRRNVRRILAHFRD
jgi:hypothetical protein